MPVQQPPRFVDHTESAAVVTSPPPATGDVKGIDPEPRQTPCGRSTGVGERRMRTGIEHRRHHGGSPVRRRSGDPQHPGGFDRQPAAGNAAGHSVGTNAERPELSTSHHAMLSSRQLCHHPIDVVAHEARLSRPCDTPTPSPSVPASHATRFRSNMTPEPSEGTVQGVGPGRETAPGGGIPGPLRWVGCQEWISGCRSARGRSRRSRALRRRGP